MPEDKIVLTKEELVTLLDVEIRRRARWHMNDSKYDASLGQRVPTTDADLPVAAQMVFDAIVSSTKYDKNLLLATRSVKKFNTSFVLRTLKKAANAGTIRHESRPDELKALVEAHGLDVLAEVNKE